MTNTVTVDKAGRIVLPKALRDELRLEPGDSLEIQLDQESVTLRPLRSSAPLRQKNGVWVFWTDRKLTAGTTDQVIADIREGR